MQFESCPSFQTDKESSPKYSDCSGELRVVVARSDGGGRVGVQGVLRGADHGEGRRLHRPRPRQHHPRRHAPLLQRGDVQYNATSKSIVHLWMLYAYLLFTQSMDVHFNEEFRFERPTQLKEEFKEALVKGLPFPILTVVE